MTKESCMCDACSWGCYNNPGWFAPEDARRAMQAGYASKMMRDWLEPSSVVGNDERIYLLAAAVVNYGGDDAPEGPDDFITWLSTPGWTKGRCNLLTDDGRCSIHDSGFKPHQCRETLGCDGLPNDSNTPHSNYYVARMWDTDLGRAVVNEWKVLVIYEGDD